ncbi:MAG TPA: SAF domain-containing protein, partial [Steroidobacter sp.]
MNEYCGTTLRLHDLDNVLVARRDIQPGEAVDFGIRATDAIPAGHKIAVVDIVSGAAVIKYGNPIGTAASHIRAGGHVHTHNVLAKIPERSSTSILHAANASASRTSRTFQGYVRPDGRVATRNYLGIVTTV